jgi:LysR family transcriptional regulator, regulator of the ytmI operon
MLSLSKQSIWTLSSFSLIVKRSVMELRHLETFQAIVKEGSFVKAAVKLLYAQSTITVHMQQLEAELGTKLFHRRGKSIQLTQAGRALYEQIDALIQRSRALQQAMKDVVAGETGHIHLGATEPVASLHLTPLLVEFCNAYPKLHLTVEVGVSRVISQRVASGALDVGICAPPDPSMGLSFEPLFAEPLRVVLPEDHPLAQREHLFTNDLLDQKVLLTDRGCEYRSIIETVLLSHGGSSFSGIEMGSTEMLKRAVQGKLGITIVPLATTCPPLSGTVVRNLENIDLHLSIGVVTSIDNSFPSHVLNALLTLLRTRLPEAEI